MNKFTIKLNYNIENIDLKMVKVECCKIDAKFKKENEVIYRRETKIFLNENNKDRCIGIVLMLNPGKCLPKGTEKIDGWQLFKDLECDNTQNNIANCVKEAYDCQPQGYAYIVNLSEKREPDSKKFYEKLSEDFDKKSEERANEIIVEIETEINKPNNQIKWVWVAFGKDERTAKLREKVLNRLKTEKLIKSILVGVDEPVNCMNPSSRNSWFYRKSKSGQIPKEIIINEIKNKLNNWGR